MDIDNKLFKQSLVSAELYFLIQKFLSNGPLKETSNVLRNELEEHKILPKRLDWTGNEHERSFSELENQYPHIGPDHLLRVCLQIGSLLNKEIPANVNGAVSLLGAGQQSLLRNKDAKSSHTYSNYYAARRHGMPIVNPQTDNHNFVNVLFGQEISGPVPKTLVISPSRYSQQQLQRRTLGHLSAVYCLLFDHSGRYILTGADDLLIKLWSTTSGRLLATFRGASAEITDIAVNLENTLLAAGSLDRILRVWDLQTATPVAILTGHTGMITSVNFCPSARWDIRYLISTSTDGSVAFWTYSHNSSSKANFVSKPIQYQEKMRPGQAQMICSSFSPGGSFLATGSADHHVRVYSMRGDEGPHRILEIEAHSDTVDSVQWAHRGLRFISGSKDGTAHVWHFECQQWKSQQLQMSAKTDAATTTTDDDGKKLKVTMVAWDCSDTWIITAVSDHRLKVWRANTGVLERALTGHTEEIYVLESHPYNPQIVLSAGHDGQVFIWDILKGQQMAHFINNIEGQGYGAVFDAKWSPDGNMIAATDSHGHILMFGFGPGNPRLKLLPTELFFHTDYRPLVRDSNHVVLDEQTQVPPHLMPPPFLVDVDGNPYPPMLQRLVPGREHCQAEQLVPNIVVGNGGTQEVIEGLPEEQPRSDIDRMIAALAQRQYGPDEPGQAAETESIRNELISRIGARTGIRRVGEIEGIRQTTGDWQKDPNLKWNKNILVRCLRLSELEKAKRTVEAVGAAEMSEYRREMRRRPIMISVTTTAAPSNSSQRGRHRKNKQAIYHTRSTRRSGTDDVEQVQESEEVSINSSSSSGDRTAREEELTSESSSESSETSGYSDWVADHGVNLEPPKRSKRRPTNASKCQITPSSDHEDEKRPIPKKFPIPKGFQGEVPEVYKPSEWLSESMPRKAPYCPQMGDEIVYFRQGQQLYVDAVRAKKVYEINPKELPWSKVILRDHEFAKIVGIKYELRPPRLCCLKLALVDGKGYLTGNVFNVKYHDMADVLDFFVLKQTYQLAVSRNWGPDDKFRCMIDDGWWIGTIVSKSAISEDFPDSHFMCYEIRWDNGEFERMSPWDLEPIAENILLGIPDNLGEAVPVLPDEIQNILYQPSVEEWPRGDRDASCRRIIAGLDKLMSLAIAEPFLAPVDLNLYPTYAFIVEYPIDLSTIKARFENHFYRRITSAQFDVRYLATNAEKFNEPHSVIVKHARIISELCLRIIKGSSDELDVAAVYHQLMDTYESSNSEVEFDIEQPGPSTSRVLRSVSTPGGATQRPDDWKREAKSLLDALWECEDSVPFRIPVDRLKHPDYYQVIDTPMDLGTVKEDLLGGNYETPNDFCKDMRLIFQNSKNYNTNKRSRIYAMTVRLSAMFEEHMSRIICNWKSVKRRTNNLKFKNRKLRRQKRTQATSPDEDNNSSSSEGPLANLKKNKAKKENVNGYLKNCDSTLNIKKKKRTDSSVSYSLSSSENESAGSSDSKHSEDSYKPVRRPLRKVVEKNIKSSSSNVSDSDDSDEQPLIVHTLFDKKNKQNHNSPKRKLKRASSASDEFVQSTIQTRKNKRPRYIEDSDSEPTRRLRRHRNCDDSEESENGLVTVSSRGRVRRLTARARALLKN